jgi:flagellin
VQETVKAIKNSRRKIMVVQHNMQAINANRQLNVTTGQQAKSTEKLSSGYKINRAADDAAGLSISEKMRKQIRGLDRASTNAQDGVSAIQTAEGALNEVQSMLQRMNELAVQSSNGTNSETDRTAIQSEIDALTTEIDRVAETTKFNESYLLKGDKSAPKKLSYTYAMVKGDDVKAATASFTADSATQLNAKIDFNTKAVSSAQNAVAKALRDSGITITRSVTYVATGGTDGASATKGTGAASVITKYTLSLTGDVANNYDVIAVKGAVTIQKADLNSEKEATGNKVDDFNSVKFEIRDKSGNLVATIAVRGGNDMANTVSSTRQNASVSATICATSASAAERKGERFAYYDKDGNKISENALNRYYSQAAGTGTDVRVNAAASSVYDAVGNMTTLETKHVAANRNLNAGVQLSLQVGADTSRENKITVNIDSMSSKNLGVNGLRVDGTDGTTADEAVNTIKEALQKVSDQRSTLGAAQNRLEHTIDNLDNVVENTTSSESRIRDTDIADEMVRYSKNNILAQAGQSMLAQANQSTQGVLSILG